MYSGLPNERTGTDQNTSAKMHVSTLITHIMEIPPKICIPVRLMNIGCWVAHAQGRVRVFKQGHLLSENIAYLIT